MLHDDISKRFKFYKSIAKDKEEVLKTLLKTQSNIFPKEQIERLPEYLIENFKPYRDTWDFENIRDRWLNPKDEIHNNSVFSQYLQAAIDDFKTNPNESIDLLDEQYKDAFFGQVNEALFQSMSKRVGLPFEGMGTERHPGDMQILINKFDIGRYIELKYTDDYMSVIQKAAKTNQNTYASTDEVYLQILADINSYLLSSFGKNYTDQWSSDIDAAIVEYQILQGERLTSEMAEKLNFNPVCLIFLMQNEGLWLSQLLDKIEPIVQTNAQSIIRKTTGKRTRDMLWYSQGGK